MTCFHQAMHNILHRFQREHEDPLMVAKLYKLLLMSFKFLILGDGGTCLDCKLLLGFNLIKLFVKITFLFFLWGKTALGQDSI